MDKQLVATVLSEIGTLLALKGENSFRCNAYHAAARAIEQEPTLRGLSGHLLAVARKRPSG